MMFFQHPSLLRFQRQMEQKRGRCNLNTIFGVKAVPSNTQMREILDGTRAGAARVVRLPELFESVRRAALGQSVQNQLAIRERSGRLLPHAVGRRGILSLDENRVSVLV